MKRIFVGVAGALIIGISPVSAGETSKFTLPSYAQIQNPIVPGETWREVLRQDVAGSAVLLDGEDLISFDAPVQAFDAATVPFSIRQRPDTGKRITRLTVVVDENPAPIAAEFEFGPLMGDINLESRVRYDIFSNIRVVAETDTGETYMTGRFVEAAGGCSAAVTRDLAVALSTIGQMKLKHIIDPSAPQMSGGVREAQLMIRHPNFTGMQVHTGTMDHIDPRFVDFIEVHQGEDLLFRMTGGFSISENPSFRFKYTDNGAQAITVRVRDTDGVEFSRTFPINPEA